MFKLWATIKKDFLILTRDKVGLTFMFVMPILLVLVITNLQVGTFNLVNENKTPLLLCDKDGGETSVQLVNAIRKIGMFELKEISNDFSEKEISEMMHKKDALVALIIPKDFSEKISLKAKNILNQTFNKTDSSEKINSDSISPITLYYHPVLQETYRSSIQSALRSALQIAENKQILHTLYFSINEKNLPDSLENEIVNSQIVINEVPVSRDGSKNIPNATQHNIPAWTVFAMFFIVISLGSNVVKEKLSGSFLRLKTLPTNFLVALLSKEILYLCVCLIQVAVIFSIGIWIFPIINLPPLNLPSDLFGLFVVSVICGWCAVSYAICIGVFAQTQEQANGFGAVSIVILAAIGGILVPSFAMPNSFQFAMKFSPLHWCLELFYNLFLEGGKLKEVLNNILILSGIAIFIQLITLAGLRRKNLI